MAVIEFVKKKENSPLLLLGISEEGESARYTVDARLYNEIGRPIKGDVLSESDMAALLYSDEYYRARKKALALLSLSDNNERTLKDKLMRGGIRREIAAEVVAEMVGRGFVDEARQLERLVLREANEALYGFYKITARLLRKGYKLSDIRRTVDNLRESGEVDFDENLARLKEKKLPEDYEPSELEKLLYKYGYKKC